MMGHKSIAAIILSIFVLIAGGCQSPADNTHAMRMNYRSERYTDEDFETVTEMIIKDLQQDHPERKVTRFIYAGDEASDDYGSIDPNPEDDEPENNSEDHDWMLFFIHFEDIHDDEFICFFSRDDGSDEWQTEGAYSSGAAFAVTDALLPQEVIDARAENQNRMPSTN